MSNNTLGILEDEDLVFLTDILSIRSLLVRESLICGYSGTNAQLVNSLKDFLSPPFSIDRMNLSIYRRLALHFTAKSEQLNTWLQPKLRPRFSETNG